MNNIYNIITKIEINYTNEKYVEAVMLVEEMPNCSEKLDLRLRLKALKSVMDNQVITEGVEPILKNIVRNNSTVLLGIFN